MDNHAPYLVTGATGFVGSAVCRLLLARGSRVIGVARCAGKVAPDIAVSALFRCVELDMSGYARLAELVGEPVGTAFHFAWQAPWGEGFSNWRTQLGNIEAACELVGQLNALSAKRLVFSGTYNQYEALELADALGAAPRPTTVYSSAKLCADLLLKTTCMQAEIDCVAGLIAMAYGPGDRSTKLTNVVAGQLLRGETPRLIPEDVPYDCIYIDDVARAFVAIAERGVPGTSYYVGHEDIQTVGWWMRAFRDVISPGAPLDFGAYPYAGGVDFARVDTGRLRRDTGVSFGYDVEAGIKATAEWIREADPLGML